MKKKLKIGILTSSRADYGVYTPLFRALQYDVEVDLHIIVFGMHLLSKHGDTANEIRQNDFGELHYVYGMPEHDDPKSISEGYGSIIQEFSKFWSTVSFDFVIALGDRYEMSAAVQASIPFEVTIVHIHGGETTLGALDNIYRHQITLASKIHFVATDYFKKRVENLINSTNYIYNVGALSLDDIDTIQLPEWQEVRKKFNIPDEEFILVTFHPETVGYNKNIGFAKEMKESLKTVSSKYHIVITLPNADAAGSIYREANKELKNELPERFTLVENFGRINYFSALKNARFLIGNTSSGIVEAASFGKYVINVGDRQKGRLQSDNIIDIPFKSNQIISTANKLAETEDYSGENIYQGKNTAQEIVNTLKHHKQINGN
ncbi:MAG: UDP-N-acetylglucosamine 2-epimerase [Candidatus Cyclobacteriaceae bacterium M2_1C_046]